ncbi:MAG: thiol peroxidase [Gammaproteobacteria bacterium]|nr:thiol peroxidase [Gammaproteobacteria bacterium]MCW5583059.1 thiol peroxidase [Gammaproteobacteria bacterium]
MATITLNGSLIHTIGTLPAIGSQAPDFIVTKPDLSDIQLKNYFGKRIILNIFPSLDTPTCAMAMRQFNEIASQFNNVMILCISKDLPFAQKRFCATEQLQNVHPVSVFRHPDFGEKYGVTIIDGPLAGVLSRAVVIIDETGKISYTEQVKELSDEPDYSTMIDAFK